MNPLENIIDFILHIDKHLFEIIQQYGTVTYIILFAIVFAETGLVFTPFLPGDSLLFAAGAFAGLGQLNVHLVFLILSLSAIIGDTLNYWIGHYMGMKLFEKYPRILKKEYLDRTHKFYEKHGGKTIIIARFMPIIRTFAPFVAGIGSMTYSRFIQYNIIGGVIWCAVFVYAGYFFGNLEVVKNNFTFVIFAIIFISVLPGLIEFTRHKFGNKKELGT